MGTSGSDAQQSSAYKRSADKPKADDREYTPEQHTAVMRVMKCRATSYYEILSVEKSCSDGQVKKAYRKLALTMHPDKNSHPQADEAFKRISKAFQILSDSQKRAIHDQTGGDPESRGGGMGGGATASPFGNAGFGGARGHPGFGGGGIDPNDLFQAFFGGGGGQFGGAFGNQFGNQFGGAQFNFGGPQFGGGPFGGFGQGGPRVYTFGGNNGARARARAAGGNNADTDNADDSFLSKLVQLLPILIIFILPTILGWFTEGIPTPTPSYSFSPRGAYTQERSTRRYKVPFFVNPKDVDGLSDSKARQLDRKVEANHVSILKDRCHSEYNRQQMLLEKSQGWFSVDEKMRQDALAMKKPGCDALNALGINLL